MQIEKTPICPYCEGRFFTKIKSCKGNRLKCKYCTRIVDPDERTFTKDFVLNSFKQFYKRGENKDVSK